LLAIPCFLFFVALKNANMAGSVSVQIFSSQNVTYTFTPLQLYTSTALQKNCLNHDSYDLNDSSERSVMPLFPSRGAGVVERGNVMQRLSKHEHSSLRLAQTDSALQLYVFTTSKKKLSEPRFL
jgi:hypothetical protein